MEKSDILPTDLLSVFTKRALQLHCGVLSTQKAHLWFVCMAGSEQ